jgi:hypothetical protein
MNAGDNDDDSTKQHHVAEKPIAPALPPGDYHTSSTDEVNANANAKPAPKNSSSTSSAMKRKEPHASSASPCGGDDEDDSDSDNCSSVANANEQVFDDHDEVAALAAERAKDIPHIFHDQDSKSLPYFLDASKHLQTRWPLPGEGQELQKTDVLNIVEELQKTPYLADCLRPHLKKAIKLFSDEHGAEEIDDSEGDQVDWRRKYRNQAIFISCMTIVTLVEKKSIEVRSQLLALSGLSQAEGTVTESSVRGSTKHSRTGDNDASAEEKRTVLAVAEPQLLYSSLIDNVKDIGQVLPEIYAYSNDNMNDTPHKKAALEKMVCVVKTFDNFVSTSTVLTNTSPEYADSVLLGLDFLQEELQRDNRSRQPGSAAAMPTKFFMPGPYGHEKDGTQPYLRLLLHAIGDCWNLPAASSSSPAKNFIRPEARIPMTKHRHMRVVDFLLQKEGLWEAVVFDDTLMVPVEVKPLRRKQKGTMALLDEARDQVLSHLAKHLFIGFRFAKFGVPCHATGVIANMAAVQIFHLRYENVGTPEATLKLYQSSLSPLMSLKNFKLWAGCKKELEELERHLFGEDGNGGMDDTIPKGIRILFNLMNLPSKKLHGLSVDAVNNEILGDQLGTGATAVVFRRRVGTGGEDSVIKVSRYGIKTGIANELKILSKLAENNQGKGSSKHIPTIIDDDDIQDGTLTVRLGSVWTNLPAIKIAPAGQNVVSFLLSSGIMTDYLDLVLDGIKSALEHMHSLKIYHCDVAPKNIVIASTSDPTAAAESGARAVLIDYSISIFSPTTRKELKGFRGTPNYVHRSIFSSTLLRKPWGPKREHDFAGLGFTLAFLANGCMRKWSVGKYPKTGDPKTENKNKTHLDSVMNSRLKKARSAVDTASIDDKLKDRINKLLDFDEKG